jgi:erlin
MKEAEANRLKLTPEFLELKFIEAIANNTKIFFGDKVKNMVSLTVTQPHLLL